MRRVYRELFNLEGFESFEVSYKKSNLFIKSCKNARFEVFKYLKKLIDELEIYIEKRKDFLSSLTPIKQDKKAPKIAQAMIEAARIAGVGPMAAVAGAVAEFIGKNLLKECNECIVENGGDVFLKLNKQATIGVFTTNPYFKDKLAINLSCTGLGCGICSSSSKIGPSLSLGRADLAMIVDKDCAKADALATKTANLIKEESDIDKAIEFAKSKNIIGCLFIKDKKLGIWGNLKVV
ncbi:UPF0280 family protein [Hippea maritima]|uniref:ApbE family lipoprotein n=1 Tax=Hippea maritima (strain ATCC 700847 / DSM 10411 / MH2) TaxID=760142 RepID=F2LX84_HIPMA|nr:UPF0280 family protein [Hippea maritima]AEA33142.1 ApbE family lipoprotein [Hippea maritima DSM 10411]